MYNECIEITLYLYSQNIIFEHNSFLSVLNSLNRTHVVILLAGVTSSTSLGVKFSYVH